MQASLVLNSLLILTVMEKRFTFGMAPASGDGDSFTKGEYVPDLTADREETEL